MLSGVYEKIRSHLGPLLLLTVLTVLVYGQIIGHDFQATWDDGFYIIDNVMIRGLSIDHVKRAFSERYFGNYAPLHLISYMLDYEIWGLWPGGYLLVNMIIHIFNGLLAYRLFVELNGSKVMAATGTAFFLLHPLQVETVAWVSQRKNLLAMFFFLLAWEFYRWYRDADGRSRIWNYVFSLILYTCAVLSKSVAVVFPVVLLLYDFCFINSPQFAFRKLGRLNLVLDKIPFIVMTAGSVVLTILSQTPAGDNWDSGGGGRSGYHGGSPLATFYSMLPVFCRYLGLLVWPAKLNAKYDTVVHTSSDTTVWLAGITLAAVAWFCYRLFLHDRRSGFWALLFWIGFLPVSQIVPLVTMMNDRYVYFPMLGAGALIGIACRNAIDRSPSRLVPAICFIIALLAASISVASYQRAGVWKDSVTLWQDSISKLSGPAAPWTALAQAYERSGSGMLVEAKDAFKRALEFEPANAYALYGLARVNVVLADYEPAYFYISSLLQRYPDHVMGICLLGTIYEKTGRYDLAEQSYNRAEKLQPDSVDIAIQRANLALVRGDLPTAFSRYQKIEARGDNFPVVAYMISWLELQFGREEFALYWLEKALQRGYANYRSIDDLQDLRELHGNPRFDELLKRYGAGKKP